MLVMIRTLLGSLGLGALLITSLSGNAFGWGRESDSKSRDAEVAKFVSERLEVWQDHLNLRDWNIRLEFVRARQLEPKTLGTVHWDTLLKVATISVLAPEDYDLSYKPMLDDMEFTIVHELVHIQLASLPRSEASRRVEEHAVNELASALLKLARR
jgi:hypothetical protein